MDVGVVVASAVDSVGESSIETSSTVTTTATSIEAEAAAPEGKTGEQQQSGGGAIDAVFLLIVQVVLAGVQGFAVLEWLLGRVSEALAWAVELCILWVQPSD
ncbi:hypothetical protein N656DRAFT_796861 [Canariomyces notabilis]|uniref:Uncharacterized protein n=1 Tax=Canariomyces notabilis TaxID=2074819 RepID=A0AAN6TH90_9PEZI|nr:hypothetical protein N656DRAFT_796861 [Canariomyces arenarius]